MTRTAAEPRSATSGAATEVVVSSTFTGDPILPVLGLWAAQLGRDWEVSIAPYGQVFQELLDPSSRSSRMTNGVRVVLVRPQDWGDEMEKNADDLVAVLDGTRGAAWTVVGLCGGEADEEARRVEARLRERLEALRQVLVVDVREAARDYAVEVLEDERGERIGHVPFTEEGFAALGAKVARAIHLVTRTPYKVIVVDCDNTLWRGVCGEVGPAGVELDTPYLELQRLLLERREQGALICLCSKNDHEDVERVFRDRQDMLLSLEHVTEAKVNWRPKSQNLHELAVELNLGLDSFVFLDDNEVECAEVMGACPEVLTLRVPKVPEELARFIAHSWALDLPRSGGLDAARAQLYAENRAREESRATFSSLADFIDSLELVNEFDAITPETLPRSAELTRRTNQFNFTTRRRTESELEDFLREPGAGGLTVSVRDRFGDYGLVGLALYRRAKDALVLDTFLLSCRVLGRGVEHAVIARLGAQAIDEGATRLEIPFTRTRKNQPALDFLLSLGDVDDPGAPELRLELTADQARGVRYAPASSAPEAAPGSNGLAPRAEASGTFAAPRARYEEIASLATAREILAELRASRRASAVEAVPVGPAEPAGSEPATDTERALAEMFRDVLDLDEVDVDQGFEDLGGNSLIAVRLFAAIERDFGLDLPISTLLGAPDVRSLATLIDGGAEGEEAESTRTQRDLRFVVQLSETVGPSLPNLFLCAGYYGNVLNLHDIAALLRGKANCYGLQSRGVREGDEPHESIEEAASDFLAEVRLVQPTGIFHLGGFSTGGVVAMAMARQLLAAGERVGVLAFLDTRTGEEQVFNPLQRLLIKRWDVARRWPDMKRNGGLLGVVRRKIGRLLGTVAKYDEETDLQSREVAIQRSWRIRDAMIRSTREYDLPRLELCLDLFRPTGMDRIRSGFGTFIDFPDERPAHVIDPDNGWGRYFARVEVTEVPGDHGTLLVKPEEMTARLHERLQQEEARR